MYIWTHLIPIIFVISAVFVTVSLAGILPESLLDQLVQISTVVGTLAVVVAVRQLHAEHERGRREKTVEYLWNWSTNLSPELPRVRKFVEVLSLEDCRNLCNGESFTISDGLKEEFLYLRDFIASFNKTNSVKKSNKGISISKQEAAILREYTVRCLNQLEALLVGWQYAILDKGDY